MIQQPQSTSAQAEAQLLNERNGEQNQAESPQSSPPGLHHDDDSAEPSVAEEHAFRNRKFFFFMMEMNGNFFIQCLSKL